MKEHKAHDARAVANYFLKRAREKDVQLTHLQLQKLVYFAHGWTLGFEEHNLIRDAVEAWEYGPVIRSVYDCFRKYGGEPVTDFARRIDPTGTELVPIWDEFEDGEIAIMSGIFDRYAKFSGVQLSAMTHMEGTPWDETRKRNDTVIANPAIEEFFKKQLNTYANVR